MTHNWVLYAYDYENKKLVATYVLPRVMWSFLTELLQIPEPGQLTHFNCCEWDLSEAQARALMRPCGVEDLPVDMRWQVGPAQAPGTEREWWAYSLGLRNEPLPLLDWEGKELQNQATLDAWNKGKSDSLVKQMVW